MKHLLLPVSLLLIPASAQAQESKFQPGTVLTEFGKVAPVKTDFKIPRGTKFKVLYDIVDPAEPGQLNRKLKTPARFLNMHAAAGVHIILCWQSVAFYGVSHEDMLPGVEMALSAMTAHAILQQEGYTLNPF